MERTDALKRLRKILGKDLGYRIDPKAATREERDAAHSELPAATAERKKLQEQRDERQRAVLAADAEYQRLVMAYDAAKKRTDRLFSVTRHYKITVGITSSMFFLIKAEGDSWEEIIDKLTAKQAA